MFSDWIRNRLDPVEREIADLLLEGRTNREICRSVFLSRARVQEYIRRVRVKTGARTTRGAIALLVEERERMALVSALDQVSEGVVIVQDRAFKFVNRALAEMCGYAVDEMTGMPFERFVAPRYVVMQNRRYDSRMGGAPLPMKYRVEMVRKRGDVTALEVCGGGLIRWRGRPAIIGLARPVGAGQ